MEDSKQKIALFIDADNAPAAKFEDVLSEVAKYGVVTIRKAYGNWKKSSLKAWEELLHEYAIQPIQQYDLSKGKNASDIALVIDAMDVMYTKDIDVMCFVSSDSDFTPMVTRALAEGKVVLGFGERKTPTPFVNACSKFLFLDRDPSPHEKSQDQPKNIKSDTKLINLLRQAIEATEEDNGWAALGPLGSHISNKTSFDTRNYGYKNLSSLIKAIDLFELKRGPGNLYLVRDVRKKKS
ncbi:NYN domain-containing protein [Gilvimarinus agarilyticus]|uniref:NYN domain-containing protein n=1 Tax=Gilvimarinus sp. 2_MG-2023 TaxID=3062666 RepID=UPI001C09899E|nr:NYN domain-containing protein [Gilvimarinus sp. 2_MG-2023]MBU2885492.1 NYN domain-containing protein [Gilvimarinus agarilyticus]MDO6570392.1 NYN domain-containing protein [Gilvimarinus sp. 2_MG-2023]